MGHREGARLLPSTMACLDLPQLLPWRSQPPRFMALPGDPTAEGPGLRDPKGGSLQVEEAKGPSAKCTRSYIQDQTVLMPRPRPTSISAVSSGGVRTTAGSDAELGLPCHRA